VFHSVDFSLLLKIASFPYLPFLTGKESGIKRGDRSRPLLK